VFGFLSCHVNGNWFDDDGFSFCLRKCSICGITANLSSFAREAGVIFPFQRDSRGIYWIIAISLLLHNTCHLRLPALLLTVLGVGQTIDVQEVVSRFSDTCVLPFICTDVHLWCYGSLRPRPHSAEALSDDACLMSICRVHQLKSRTERPRTTKIGTEVAHVARDSDITFKVKRSKVNLQGAGARCGWLPHSLFVYALHYFN